MSGIAFQPKWAAFLNSSSSDIGPPFSHLTSLPPLQHISNPRIQPSVYAPRLIYTRSPSQVTATSSAAAYRRYDGLTLPRLEAHAAEGFVEPERQQETAKAASSLGHRAIHHNVQCKPQRSRELAIESPGIRAVEPGSLHLGFSSGLYHPVYVATSSPGSHVREHGPARRTVIISSQLARRFRRSAHSSLFGTLF